MKRNMGNIDRIIRIVLALLIGAAGIYFNSWWGLLGLLPLFTSIVNWCPAYHVFGISSCKREVQQ
jgi:hypothetical protein